MCTHRKYITNPYTGRRVLVSCGRCDACKQAKANRLTSRLEQSSQLGDICLFVMLSYSDDYVPYVLKKDLETYGELDSIPIYRKCSIRHFKGRVIKHDESVVVGTLDKVLSARVKDNLYSIPFAPNLHLKNGSFDTERMGVPFYKDFQDFKKRLRTSLARKYGDVAPQFSIYGCSELGETYFRPHFHTLVYANVKDYKPLRDAIIESWPFHDWSINPGRKIQIARDAAAYVASYVNCSSDIPEVFKNYLRPKHSFSPSIGLSNPYYSLDSILARCNTSSLFYPRRIVSDGVPTFVNLPIPQYVLNRYFPRFKGYCRCSFDSLVLFLSKPNRYTFLPIYASVVPQDPDHIHRIIVSIKNAQQRYISLTSKTSYDYALDYINTWSAYKNTLLRLNYESELPLSEWYDNWNDLQLGSVHSDLVIPNDAVLDPNLQSHILVQNRNLEDLYRKKIKQRKTTDFIFNKFL